MHARFYVPGLALDRATALPAEEAEHLVRVLRLGVGARIVAFDGRGGEYLARVESATRREVIVRATSEHRAAPEPAVRLTVAIAATRGDRMDSAVRDASMLGARTVQPVVSAHAETSVAALARAHRVDRWHRVAVSSVKQCGRAVVPDILPPIVFAEYVSREVAEMRLMFVEPSAGRPTTLAGISTPASAALLIGPEGGWTTEEIDKARASGFHAVTLGRRTLRADAMPIAAIAVLQFLWGDL